MFSPVISWSSQRLCPPFVRAGHIMHISLVRWGKFIWLNLTSAMGSNCLLHPVTLIPCCSVQAARAVNIFLQGVESGGGEGSCSCLPQRMMSLPSRPSLLPPVSVTGWHLLTASNGIASSPLDLSLALKAGVGRADTGRGSCPLCDGPWPQSDLHGYTVAETTDRSLPLCGYEVVEYARRLTARVVTGD